MGRFWNKQRRTWNENTPDPGKTSPEGCGTSVSAANAAVKKEKSGLSEATRKGQHVWRRMRTTPKRDKRTGAIIVDAGEYIGFPKKKSIGTCPQDVPLREDGNPDIKETSGLGTGSTLKYCGEIAAGDDLAKLDAEMAFDELKASGKVGEDQNLHYYEYPQSGESVSELERKFGIPTPEGTVHVYTPDGACTASYFAFAKLYRPRLKFGEGEDPAIDIHNTEVLKRKTRMTKFKDKPQEEKPIFDVEEEED